MVPPNTIILAKISFPQERINVVAFLHEYVSVAKIAVCSFLRGGILMDGSYFLYLLYEIDFHNRVAIVPSKLCTVS